MLTIVISNTEYQLIFIKIKKKLMLENSNDYKICIKEALDNAKKRISTLDNSDKKCVLDEYKEWINDDLSSHQILLIREDPII